MSKNPPYTTHEAYQAYRKNKKERNKRKWASKMIFETPFDDWDTYRREPFFEQEDEDNDWCAFYMHIIYT